jgi:hypothetical protein
MSAIEIALRNLAKSRQIAQDEALDRAKRLEARTRELQAFFAEHPDVKAWAEDMKAHFGDGVRVKRFGK